MRTSTAELRWVRSDETLDGVRTALAIPVPLCTALRELEIVDDAIDEPVVRNEDLADVASVIRSGVDGSDDHLRSGLEALARFVDHARERGFDVEFAL